MFDHLFGSYLRHVLLTILISLYLAFPDLNVKEDGASDAVTNSNGLGTGSKPATTGSWAGLFPKAAAPTELSQLPVEGPDCEQLGGKRLFHIFFF